MSETIWWARSKTNARVTTAALTVLALVLASISYFVWASPSSPVHRAAVTGASAINPLSAENEDLRKKLTVANVTIYEQSKKLEKVTAASVAAQAANAKKLAVAQQKMIAAEQALARSQSHSSTGGADQAAGSGAGHSGSTGASGESGTTVAAITAPSRAQLLAPAKRYFGMYTEQAPFNWATFDSTSAKIGVQPNLVGYFSGWDENYRANAVTRAWAQGRLPMMTWESRPISAGNNSNSAPDYSLPKIIGDPAKGIPGTFDTYLHQYAKAIVATGLPLAIRLDHEMNGTWYPWSELNGSNKAINGNRVGDYVKMWRHVHDIFQQEGANALVIWVWAPNIVNNLQPSSHASQQYLASLYPGDAYVDWVGLSGYLRPPYRAGNNFTFGYTFDTSLGQLRALTKKPIILAEVGASETDGHKPTWVKSFFDGFADPKNSDVIGFSWFNLAITSYVGGERSTNDWRIDSRSDSLQAFITGLTRPEDDFTLIPAR
ncbi:glycoside hydrolase family 26 protein [Diaminobutyricibacter sp. McL0608]|uniref:glycoside hydrolase family 26 protein n=1 Tax=Leifsonia sp. McL0608 TaxID=3143537 RepID=UPI0031F3096B